MEPQFKHIYLVDILLLICQSFRAKSLAWLGAFFQREGSRRRWIAWKTAGPLRILWSCLFLTELLLPHTIALPGQSGAYSSTSC